MGDNIHLFGLKTFNTSQPATLWPLWLNFDCMSHSQLLEIVLLVFKLCDTITRAAAKKRYKRRYKTIILRPYFAVCLIHI
jgi:hypothetical protein